MADVEGLFLRGKEAADRGNYDYAITLFIDALRMNPDHRNMRIALRGCEMERFRAHGGGVKAKLLGFLKGIGPFVMMHLTRNPIATMNRCEKYLRYDPTNVHVLRKLASACEKLGHLDAAADTLEFARQRSPRNLGILRQLGNVHHKAGAYDKAVRCFQEIVSVKPEDREATERVKDISAEAHLKKSHMEGAESYRDSLRDAETTDRMLQEEHVMRSAEHRGSEIDRLQKAAEEHPDDAKAFASLGDAYYRNDQFTEAERAYAKAFEIGKKFGMREKMGDARIRRLEHAEAKTKDLAETGDPIGRAKYREARQRRLEFCIKEYVFRRQHHPTDMKLCFRLGQYYFEMGGEESVAKAVQEFQQAMSNVSLKVQAQYMLGRCFMLNSKTLDMAREQFAEALAQLDAPSGQLGKQIMYEMASIDEKTGKAEQALALYKKIFSVDAGFKDVAKKIQTLG